MQRYFIEPRSRDGDSHHVLPSTYSTIQSADNCASCGGCVVRAGQLRYAGRFELRRDGAASDVYARWPAIRLDLIYNLGHFPGP